MMSEPKYKRVLLKVSGEALAGEKHTGLDFDMIGTVCDVIKEAVSMGVQVGVVIGGGNFWRGRSSGEMDRPRADQMGMLATTINSLALCDTLEQLGVKATVMTSLVMPQVADIFTKREAVKNLSEGKVVIFAAGTGNPYFSTDTGVVLRGVEIEADAILMAKKGVSFVLQGPPGTGKSQTITNIIAECLSDGKKVLFVSEKLAALNVVYEKLKQAGLAEFCLELHSHKANKKDVIAELCHTLRATKSAVSSKAQAEISAKVTAQRQLDQYAEELHKLRPVINKTLSVV